MEQNILKLFRRPIPTAQFFELLRQLGLPQSKTAAARSCARAIGAHGQIARIKQGNRMDFRSKRSGAGALA